MKKIALFLILPHYKADDCINLTLSLGYHYLIQCYAARGQVKKLKFILLRRLKYLRMMNGRVELHANLDCFRK